jgi:hypothetical protein
VIKEAATSDHYSSREFLYAKARRLQNEARKLEAIAQAKKIAEALPDQD